MTTQRDIMLDKIHKLANHHKTLLNKSAKCGCFKCKRIFFTSEIEDYTDNKQTALCPYCDVNAVIPENDLVIIDLNLLEEMNNKYF